MSNVLTIIKKELFRFFGDKRLVMTTVILPGAMIYVMYSLMGGFMQREFSLEEDYVASAYVKNFPEELDRLAKERGVPIEWTKWDGGEPEEVFRKIEEGDLDLAVVFPEGFMKEVESYETGKGEAPGIEIYYNSAKTNSFSFYNLLTRLLDAYEKTLVNKFDVNRSEETSEEGSLGKYDRAPKNGIAGQLLSGMLPLLIMTFIFSGCQGVAPESIAGEKERGTMATLLVTPVKRSSIALGKVVALSVTALLSGISSFLGTILSIPQMMGDRVDLTVTSYGAGDYAVLFLVIVSTVFVLVSAISIISSLAGSVKEATTLMAPFMIIVMLISLLPMLGMDVGGKAAYFVPLLGSVKAMAGIFGFTPDIPMALLSIVVNVLVSGILVVVLTFLFSSEKVMFGR